MASPVTGDGEIRGATVVDVIDDDEISPLLADAATTTASAATTRDGSNPKMSIFSVSYSRRRSFNKDSLVGSSVRADETEIDVLTQIVSWIWNGSRYSGLLCVASASVIYFVMEILVIAFPVRSIPLLQTLVTRCTILSSFSFLWLRRTGRPLFVPTHVRNLLIWRSLAGLLSMLSFIYSVQNLLLPLAMILNFTTPVMASIGAKIYLQEKLGGPFYGGLTGSLMGLLLIFLPMLILQGDPNEAGDMYMSNSVQGSHPIFAILVGLFSSTLGGVSYCLIQAGAKASDHPAYTVLSFGLLTTPVSAICALTLQEFVLPSVSAFLLMVVLGVLAFFAEICLARGLQIDKVGKVTNILYMKVVLWQLWSMAFLGVAVSFSRLIGCFLILASICTTVYLGPEKEIQ